MSGGEYDFWRDCIPASAVRRRVVGTGLRMRGAPVVVRE